MNIKRTKKDAPFSFDSLYSKAIEIEMPVDPRTPCFRLSSSPFCSMRSLLEWVDHINNVGNTWNFSGDFFCDIGTAVHSALQKWVSFANPATILGHWRCVKCCKHPHAEECVHCTENCKLYREAVVGPQFCPVCGRPMLYQEFQYLLPKVPASGHSDGIMLFDPKSVLGIESELDLTHVDIINKLLKKPGSEYQFPAYILEYKTTGINRVKHMTEPLTKHQAQATMYVGCCHEILPKKYGLVNLDIKGVLIKYITRDHFSRRSRDFQIDVEDDEFYKFNKNMIYKCIKSFYNKDVDRIVPRKLPCVSGPYQRYYNECQYGEMCQEYRNNRDLRKQAMKKIRPLFMAEMDGFAQKFNHPFKKD